MTACVYYAAAACLVPCQLLAALCLVAFCFLLSHLPLLSLWRGDVVVLLDGTLDGYVYVVEVGWCGVE